MVDPASVRFKGPLAPYFVGFWSELMRQGYSPLTAAGLLSLASHFSRWLDSHGLEAADVTAARVAEFATHRRRRGYDRYRSPRGMRPLFAYLRGIGVAQPEPPIVETAVDRLLSQYGGYLESERGLVASTIRGYTDFARRFIASRPADSGLKWERLKPADITAFVLREAQRWSVGQCKYEVTALRSLLRYLHLLGRIGSDLAGCVPAVAGWRLAWLPKALDPDQVQRVLRCCDPRSVVGLRDAAIVRLLLRLGLRAGDVAELTLDDLDWRAGEIVLRGKGRREIRMPLPHDVGRVLVAYLRRGRPRTSSRRVFLRSRAPFTPLAGSSVVGAVGRLLRRAGVTGGAHLLRHTAATQMLQRGASLPEIAHVLRHRHVDTTAIYAKVDFAALRALAQPWPGGAP